MVTFGNGSGPILERHNVFQWDSAADVDAVFAAWHLTLDARCVYTLIAGSLEAAYSLNWGAREIWGKGGGETLALLW